MKDQELKEVTENAEALLKSVRDAENKLLTAADALRHKFDNKAFWLGLKDLEVAREQAEALADRLK